MWYTYFQVIIVQQDLGLIIITNDFVCLLTVKHSIINYYNIDLAWPSFAHLTDVPKTTFTAVL